MTGQPQLVTVRTLFDGQRRFRVPIYQRAYAWGKVEIETLIRDVASVLDRSAYYIGSLVLHEVRDIESDQPVFDVIDGQQRLTTLFITLTHPDLRDDLLGLDRRFEITDRLLSFEERKRSNLDLAALARPEVTPVAMKSLQDDGIKAGAEAVANLLGDEARLEKVLLDQGVRWEGSTGTGLTKSVLSFLLDHVHIVLTELPPDTDLNHYFEVMNTRGEQLEKHEIVKAHLLGLIGEDNHGRALFSTIWDACSDFTRHVQARFKPSERSAIFGDHALLGEEGWSTFLPKGISGLRDLFDPTRDTVQAADWDLDSLLETFVPKSPAHTAAANQDDDGDAGRYGAIIDFPNFLLHVLRLYAGDDSDISLDDKKLVAQFERTIRSAPAALDFAYRLLRAKFLFDNFIIKPLDEPGGSDDSNWVIHRLHYIRPESRSAKLSPVNAFGAQTQQVVMLQAMYQVTHQRRVYKEFFYQLVEYLDTKWAADRRIDGQEFIRHIHQMADDDLDALEVMHGDGLNTGTGVPHFAFNLLDYKLWWLSEIDGRPPAGLPVVKASGFRFAYRTSIEHFLPSNLAEREDQLAVINDFGNLCLMTRTENSRRSDHTPDWKVEKYGMSDQSLKFHYMAELQRAAREWGPRQISNQGAAMRKVLFTPLTS
ncbi:DUF262 domain-containing protein [Trebonia kvetii]|uniref:DUF262 domain-containing protein n=1 Tax=Trebonia kvetii TaxID=2480626 RepID=A0A6P2BLU6_9ACTN|nr:DUF262 domain-containing protein [Trebonia kvetii]TVY99983.1 DUF262 domain-containing protein [Trebonia kvetii]